jgi:hypothetical protein
MGAGHGSVGRTQKLASETLRHLQYVFDALRMQPIRVRDSERIARGIAMGIFHGDVSMAPVFPLLFSL